MKNVKLHILVLAIVVISEFIGTQQIPLGFATIILLPMLFAMVIGLIITMKPLQIAKEKEMKDAGSLVSLTLLLLMAKYGCNIGPTIPQLISASPALILQEFGNIGTVFLGVPLGLAHSISREGNVALISEKFGLDSDEGEGVLGVYIVGTVLGTVIISLLTSIFATLTPLHPYALAMASGVGSASMMTASVGTLVELFPSMAETITSFGVASNVLSGLDGLYMSIFISLPLSEWLYRVLKSKKEKGVKYER